MENNIQIATFAGGCFWCTETVFMRLDGVEKVVSGYTGGHIKNPAYREVCTGRTGHAEGVQIYYNENKITYQELLEIFFATHDPTTLNRQGNDVGTQYRSEIFYHDDNQKNLAEKFIEFLEKEQVFDSPIATKLTPFEVFYKAEDYHQNYYNQNSEQSYCQFVISPKLKKFKVTYANKLKQI